MKTRVATLLSLSLLLHPALSLAQWIQDGAPISRAYAHQFDPVIVSDGAGGAIIAWEDNRAAGLYNDIYAQRINASGAPQWTTDGVLICAAADNQWAYGIVTDGVGGAIIVWTDDRIGSPRDIYARRVSAAGVPQWTADGVAVCTAALIQNYPVIVSDGAGGAVIAWQDNRNGSNYNIFAQRLNGSGAVQWAANGVPICSAAGDQTFPVITTDGAAGAIMSWWDYRNADADLFAQRVNSAGVVQWNVDGTPIAAYGGSTQLYPTIASDGAGGAVIAWSDTRNINFDIYAQRIGPTGISKWYPGGELVSYGANDQDYPLIASDGAAGAIISWVDLRDFATNNYDVYAQHMSATGAPLWKQDGVPVCTQPNEQSVRSVLSDGAGGGVFVWEDHRSGSGPGYSDIYAQRVNSTGNIQWGYDGVALCTTSGDSYGPKAIADGPGGALVTWYDWRTGQVDVFAQRVDPRYGYWGRPEPTLTTAKDNPKDQGGKVNLNWTASGRDDLNEQLINRYSIWRAMDVAPASAGPASSSVIAGATVIDKPVTSSVPAGKRVVWHEQSAATDYYWELIGSQGAYYNSAYSFTAPTRADSVAGNTATEYFRIVAEGYSQFYNWPSNTVSAHSVDNLAPTPPLALIAQRAGNYVHLKWNRVHVPDLKDYSVYRKTSSGVTPIPINFLASANDTVLTDTSPPASAIYYAVTAYDVHANQSPPSNEAAVAPATGVGNLPPITALTVLQNHPNPFTGETELSIGLPAPSDVNIDVFDVAGRKVSTISVNHAGAGWQKMAFSGRDSEGHRLASGVYFYRVHANGTTVTRKMVITR
jgi:hypothetical protein